MQEKLADTASLEGVQTEVAALNDRGGSLPKEGAVLIVTSSYNGKPLSNAGQFVQWLEELKPDELKVFNTQFLVVETIIGLVPISEYQDTLMSKWLKKGATRFSTRGEADAKW